MRFSKSRNTTRWVIILISFSIITLILWNTYTFFQIFKNEERLKMNLFADAQKTVVSADEYTELDLPLKILNKNTTIPVILTMYGKIISAKNIPDEILKDNAKSISYLNNLKNENDPIVIEYAPGKYQELYYGNSALINKLKYYPVALLLIIFLFGALIYNFYRSTKMATQNKLWAGMAKETAHQIGTPLSSLIGWVEILKTEEIDQSITAEIEKDVDRLQTITDRFSKIGSVPVLEEHDIIAETLHTYEYLQSRFSKQVAFSYHVPQEPVFAMINPTLHSWTIENLVKNAIDAMKGKGTLDLQIEQDAHHVKINVKDSGTGIAKKQFKTIFEPGFTTKKRGWGLGLSLTKRIVEEYHSGKIKVLHSEIGKGTTFQISLNKKV
ncbi:histidine kinase/DNA gyrase B/HSP90-like ATPase [Flavobacterium araucananum]|jgi:two-component system, sporulation sensor kinase D|uniref:histidine kinase n=1 Tax=Flavobacterium araucananum TaxID=946678 RepID=A0A227P0J5_9FLAO|nr:HAMP domain-containing sensor histidine kinase [Flavobacterium araucananum]OXG03063.1 two-component sensor histidine kinase [Flavobacterium araucananum]PWK03064.1 histidine kinase/DNA gyrase B/HSP90-like ATPase [Flavobacterium araucananum]